MSSTSRISTNLMLLVENVFQCLLPKDPHYIAFLPYWKKFLPQRAIVIFCQIIRMPQLIKSFFFPLSSLSENLQSKISHLQQKYDTMLGQIMHLNNRDKIPALIQETDIKQANRSNGNPIFHGPRQFSLGPLKVHQNKQKIISFFT